METAHGEGYRISWRIKYNVRTCSIPKCNEIIGPSYLGLPVCWKHMDRHWDARSKFTLMRYANGENSRFIVRGDLKGVGRLETLGQNGSNKLLAGSEVVWVWDRATSQGKVEGITTRDSDTVNRMSKVASIADIVIVWIKPKVGPRIGLVPVIVEPLTESEEEEEAEEQLDLDDLLNSL